MKALRYDVNQEYDELNKMIKETSTMYDDLVLVQGSAFCLQFARWTMYLCLVRQNDGQKSCCAVRWAKYRVSDGGRKSWYNGWKPGKVPASTKKRIETEDYHRFKELDDMAREISRIRKKLVEKKMRILGTFNSVQATDKPELEKTMKRFEELFPTI